MYRFIQWQIGCTLMCRDYTSNQKLGEAVSTSQLKNFTIHHRREGRIEKLNTIDAA